MKKAKILQLEVVKALAKFQETQRLAQEAEAEDLALVETVAKNIEREAEVNGFFCGIIFTPEDLGEIVTLMGNSKQNVKVPFRLYFTDSDLVKETDGQPVDKPEKPAVEQNTN